MSTVHATVGTLVVIGYLLLLALNIATLIRGRGFEWQRYVSYGAAILLLLQYILGFSLLGEGKSINGFHFIIALLAILPVGFEHGYANTKPSLRERAQYGALANFVTLVLVLIAYIIGQSQ